MTALDPQASDITHRVFNRQLLVLAADRFELCVVEKSSGMANRRIRSLDQIIRSISWLKYKNAHGWHVYVRPETREPIVLMDDLTREGLQALDDDGLDTLCVVETSPRNYQAWLRVSNGPIPHELATAIGELLAERYAADLRAKSYRQLGRAVGFTNVKDKYQGTDGYFPYVRLLSAAGCPVRKPERLKQEAELRLEKKRAQRAQVRKRYLNRHRVHQSEDPFRFFERSVQHIRQQYGSAVDLSRADASAARHMAIRGYTREQVSHAMLDSADIASRRGHRAEDYIERTVAWAFSNV